MKAICIFLIIGAFCFAGDPEKTGHWFDEIAPAQKLAKEKKLPLLIVFLGPDWCHFSNSFEEEILSEKTFINALKSQCVFLKIEIPKDFDRTSFDGKSLKENYHIEECPSVVLADYDTSEIAKIDCTTHDSHSLAQSIQMTLEDFREIEKVSNKCQLKSLKFNELKSLYAKAQKFSDPSYKRNLLKEGLKTDQGPYFLLKEYEQLLIEGLKKNATLLRIRNKIAARDPENILGCRRKLALLDFEALANVKRAQKTSNVIKPLVEYLKKFGEKDPEHAWRLEMKISQYLFAKNQINESLQHAEACLQLAPESEKSHISESIAYLRNFSQDALEK